ncbi:proteasome-associated protein ECM29 homolog [Centruroides sculpturatus]|uniref:proteasome-associated protein ECM29 homolog n=1 Tax=Centruroides sculpturatus TaxID=218467 RepID=UPI000C6E5CB0|nr:proteasome-associated protein ECM29 homolog [Centruroides sculpturatus]
MTSQDESVLLERVFLRIGSAETDEQLQNALTKFLPPVLLKLSSPQEHIRKKVMELLVHINKRLKSRPQVQLPMEALLLQYGDPAATTFSINFTIIYLKLGYPRMEIDRQISLIPNLLSCIDNKPLQHKERRVMELLVHINKRLKSRPQVQLPMEALLLQYGDPAATTFSINFTIIYLKLGYPRMEIDRQISLIPNLLSCIDNKPLQHKESVASSADLELRRLTGVASSADLELRRLTGVIDWNNKQLVSKLYSIFLGTTVTKNQIQPELQRTPGNTRIRLKVFPYLLKSKEASMTIPSSVQVIFESIYGENTNLKLKTMALQFVHFMCSNCDKERLNLVATVIMSGMLKLVTESDEEPQIKSMAYVAVGMLATKLPHLVTKNIAVIQTFFDALTKEEKDVRISIQESLSLLAKAFSTMDQNTQCLMESLISTSIENPISQVRLMAVHYAATIFPSDHISSRYILLLAAGDSNEEVKMAAIKALHNVAHHEISNKLQKKNLYPSFPAFIKFMTKKTAEKTNVSSKTKTSKCLPFNVATYIEVFI